MYVLYHFNGMQHLEPVPVSGARAILPSLVDKANYTNARIPLSKHGEPVAAIVSYADLQRLEELEDARDCALLKEAMANSKEPPLTFSEMLAFLDIKPDDLKAAMDA